MKPAKCRPALLAKKASTTGCQPGASFHSSGAKRSSRETCGSSMSDCWACGTVSAAEQRRQGLARVLGAHESLAHEERMDAGCAHGLDVGPGRDAGFRYHDAITRNIGKQ